MCCSGGPQLHLGHKLSILDLTSGGSRRPAVLVAARKEVNTEHHDSRNMQTGSADRMSMSILSCCSLTEFGGPKFFKPRTEQVIKSEARAFLYWSVQLSSQLLLSSQSNRCTVKTTQAAEQKGVGVMMTSNRDKVRLSVLYFLFYRVAE